MRKKIAGALLLAALVAIGLVATVGPIGAGAAEGRQIDGQFCTNPQALPKPGACIALSFGEQTAQGYTDSPDRVLSLRPGTYWLTVARPTTSRSRARTPSTRTSPESRIRRVR